MVASRVQHNKQHKSRFSSKSSRNAHKVPLKDKHKIAKSERNVAKGARSARLQRNKMMRDQKRAELLKEKRASSGVGSPPRVVVLFGLSASVNLDSLENDLTGFFSEEEQGIKFPAIVSTEHKLRATILKAPNGNLSACMEMAKVADLIAFVASASSLYEDEGSSPCIDSFGSQCLSVFRAVGLPSTVVLIRDLPVESKRRNDIKKSCISNLASEFPEDCKIYPAETKDELRKFIWLLKEHRLTAPHWRSQRPYVMAQEVDWVADDCTPGKGSFILTGYLRAHVLSVNQLIHVSGAGDFQLSKIELLKDPCPLNARKGGDLMDSDDNNQIQVIRCLTPDPMKQELLLVENIPDPLTWEQNWPTEEEMAVAGREANKKPKRRILPPGTSEYQSAWIVENSDDDYSDGDISDDDDMVLDEGRVHFPGQGSKDFEFDEDDDDASTKFDDETDTASMVDGENPTREQLEDEIRKIKEKHAEDEEYPDEVDTPLDVPARRRFAKYRGLKSFRTSSWDPKESLPAEYAKIFAFDNFTRTQKHVLARAFNMEQGNVDDYIHPGSYVRLYVKDVPAELGSKLSILLKTMPVILCGLLQHESKISVLHFSIKKHDTYAAPLKSKEELTFHVGFRQFVTRPVYSSDTMNSDKSKMERFLHAGRFSIASIYAPISFPPLPLIAFKNVGDEGSQVLAAIGSLRSIDLDRIILKKIILTGYPERVSKLKATVRFMFHNPDDVRWFKPVEVWTKYGRRGRVKEPVGTHGSMKCIFNGVLQQHDTVCMSLYKRVYPKWPQHWFPMIAS